MKTATVRDLRNQFGRLSKWLESGETVLIVQRGRPVARLVPEHERQSFVNACPAHEPLPDDLDEPVDLTRNEG